MKVVGYVRVSTSEQGESGLGLAAQREAIRREADAKGYEVVAILEDVASGGTVEGREGLAEARRMVEKGEAQALIVARLDRLSRSVADFSALLERFRRKGWGLVILDLGVDTTTIMGEAMAGVAAVMAQTERRLIGERTKAALAVKRSQGVRLGRPRLLSDDVRSRIVEARERGETFARIAESLNEEGVPTAQGGARWYPATVRKVCATA